MAEEELTDEDRVKIVARMGSLALLIERSAREMHDLSDALRTKVRAKRKEVDSFGDPTFRFERKVPLPKDIKLTRAMRDYAVSKNFNASTIAPMWEEFTNYYRRAGTKWQDWSAVWQKWVRTESERKRTGQSTSRDLQEL